MRDHSLTSIGHNCHLHYLGSQETWHLANTPSTDDTLRQLLQTDADQALTFLFKEYYTDLCRSALRILKEEAKAEDLVQEVFLELWRKRKQLKLTGSVRAYLHRSVRNRSLNYLRDQRLPTLGEEAMPNVGSAALAPQQLEAEELQARIDEVIDELPERCRLVFVLSRFEEMSQKEIAEQLGISTKTVENQMTKALKILRQSLSPYLGLWLWILSAI